MALNILVVDDSSVMREMVIKTLRLSGVALNQIHQAANGHEALTELNQQRIDLALVDINMPVMGGLELIERLRATPKFVELPIIVVSTESSQDLIEMLQQKGISFVHKPFSPESLSQTIVNVTGAI
jgi:two-component system, chemotaxis family, chemotaxis protein CheY